MSHSHLHWSEVSARDVYDARIFRVQEVVRRSADGREGSFIRLASPDWANVAAVTEDSDGAECLVLVRQYRQGADAVTLELPGGLVDEHEDPKTAAARELSEETGYHADSLTLLGSTNPNPAFMTNTVYTFAAEGVDRRWGQRLDANEIVDVELVPVEAVLSMARPEFNCHAIMLAALAWFRPWYEGRNRVEHP